MTLTKTLEQAIKICNELLRNWDIEAPEKLPFSHRFKVTELDNPEDVNWVLDIRQELLEHLPK